MVSMENSFMNFDSRALGIYFFFLTRDAKVRTLVGLRLVLQRCEALYV